jgi:hypothetical protein
MNMIALMSLMSPKPPFFLLLYLQHHIKQLYFSNATPYHIEVLRDLLTKRLGVKNNVFQKNDIHKIRCPDLGNPSFQFEGKGKARGAPHLI